MCSWCRSRCAKVFLVLGAALLITVLWGVFAFEKLDTFIGVTMLLGTPWIFFVTVSVGAWIAGSLSRRSLGWLPLALAVLATPSYWGVQTLKAHSAADERKATQTAIVRQDQASFAQLCTQLPSIEVRERRPDEAEPNVRFLGMGLIYNRRDFDSRFSDEFVCWLNLYHQKCPKSAVIGIDLYFDPAWPACLMDYPQRGDCNVESFRHDRDRIAGSKVSDRNTRYVLLIEETKPADMVRRYQLTVRDLATREDLATAWLVGLLARPDGTPNQYLKMSFCPARDETVARLLSDVSPLGPDGKPRRSPR